MKIALLTSQTPHHAFFAKKLTSSGYELAIVCETAPISFKYETTHVYENERDEYELDFWFEGEDIRLSSFENYIEVENVNCMEVNHYLAGFNPEFSFCFGTRKICLEVLTELKENTLNFHGADPEKYRGLDSQLWAIWHKDYMELKTCLHKLNDELDAGDVFDMISLDIDRIQKIEDVRILNTENCVKLASNLLEKVSRGETLNFKKQKQKGRYYSAMPSTLKDIVIKRFKSGGLIK